MVDAVLEFDPMQTLNHGMVNELRTKLGITQAEAARRADVSVGRWNDLEKGRRSDNLKLETIAKIAAALEVADVRVLITDPTSTKKGKGKKK